MASQGRSARGNKSAIGPGNVVTPHRSMPYAPLEEVAELYQAVRRVACKTSSLRQMETRYRTLTEILSGMVADPSFATQLGPFLDLAHLYQSDLDEYVKRRSSQRLSRASGQLRAGGLPGPMTIYNELSALISLHLFARKRMLIPTTNPLENIRRPHVEVTYLEPHEVEKLLASCEHPFAYLLLLLAANTGMRSQEMLHLQVRDVVDDAVYIRRKEYGNGKVWTPKTYHVRRAPLTRRVRTALTEHIAQLEHNGPEDFIFPGYYRDQPIAPLWRQINKAFRAAGLYRNAGRDGIHALRRTWATRMLGSGVTIAQLMRLGGWRNLATVQRYVTASRDDAEAAMLRALGD